MKRQNNTGRESDLGYVAIVLHLGLLVFGVMAWATGFLAGDYKKMEQPGYTIHGWIGLSVAVFAFLRLIMGLAGPRSLRFADWMPFTRERIKLAAEDVAGLANLRMPDRGTHQGLAGVVQAFGLVVFFLMAASGVFLYIFLEPGQKAQGFVHDVKELHEAGVALIPLFLSLHVGAVILHALHGKAIWKKMFFIDEKEAGAEMQ